MRRLNKHEQELNRQAKARAFSTIATKRATIRICRKIEHIYRYDNDYRNRDSKAAQFRDILIELCGGWRQCGMWAADDILSRHFYKVQERFHRHYPQDKLASMRFKPSFPYTPGWLN